MNHAINNIARPKLHLVITNISKPANVRSLLKGAAAFGCASVLVVGQRTFDFDANGRDIPSSLKRCILEGALVIQRFNTWAECVAHLKELQIRLVGVEIHEQAQSIESFFDGKDTALLLGNEGTGLNQKQMDSCDAFLRIPQYGGGTASLNVSVAANIVFHRFHQWCNSVVETTNSEDS